MIVLPKNLATIADVASDYSGRYSMTGVKVSTTVTGYRAEATDGRRAIIATGPSPEMCDRDPRKEVLAAVPNGTTEGIIDAEAFKKFLKAAPKKMLRKLDAEGIAIVLGDKNATLASTDGVSVCSCDPPLLEGRFPDISQVVPVEESQVRMTFNAKLFLDFLSALKTMVDLTKDTDEHVVVFDFYGPDKPIKVQAKNNGHEVLGLIMPLTPPDWAK